MFVLQMSFAKFCMKFPIFFFHLLRKPNSRPVPRYSAHNAIPSSNSIRDRIHCNEKFVNRTRFKITRFSVAEGGNGELSFPNIVPRISCFGKQSVAVITGRVELINPFIKAAAEDHRDADCLVVVAMSHGESGLLYSSDNMYPVDMLWAPFTADRCSTLAGKPKLFFIQVSHSLLYLQISIMVLCETIFYLLSLCGRTLNQRDKWISNTVESPLTHCGSTLCHATFHLQFFRIFWIMKLRSWTFGSKQKFHGFTI